MGIHFIASQDGLSHQILICLKCIWDAFRIYLAFTRRVEWLGKEVLVVLTATNEPPAEMPLGKDSPSLWTPFHPNVFPSVDVLMIVGKCPVCLVTLKSPIGVNIIVNTNMIPILSILIKPTQWVLISSLKIPAFLPALTNSNPPFYLLPIAMDYLLHLFYTTEISGPMKGPVVDITWINMESLQRRGRERREKQLCRRPGKMLTAQRQ